MRLPSPTASGLGLVLGALVAAAALAAEPTVRIGGPALSVEVTPSTGAYRIVGGDLGDGWGNPRRFGEATLLLDGRSRTVPLAACEARADGAQLRLTFRPVEGKRDLTLAVTLRLGNDGRSVQFGYEAAPALQVQSIRLVDEALRVTRSGRGYLLAPVRVGLMIPADSGKAFTHSLTTYAYEGTHMTMLGAVEAGRAALLTWTDPYVSAELRSVVASAGGQQADGGQTVTGSLVMRRPGSTATLTLLGPGDHVTVAKAYREVAKARGLLVTWDRKIQERPQAAKLLGASNFKLWSVLDRRMDEESKVERSVRVNWTFDEAGQVAEHLKRDLKMDDVLFIMGGWIRRGYDNQHPDILPTAPECGGDEAFARACRTIRDQGYVLGLHDNYQDMYRDAPSWDEAILQKGPDGKPARGGTWAGGRAYLVCPAKQIELARRPQNLPAVRKLSGPAAYFIDVTYATNLQDCYDPNHPLDRAQDIVVRAELSRYARDVFGLFGSECGREWAIPHADFFEGLTGVSGGPYHDKNLVGRLGGVVVPLFELVYRDTIAMYGKYGYDIRRAAPYVLQHVAIGRPMHYHNVPRHLYWKDGAGAAAEAAAATPLKLTPSIAEMRATGPRELSVRYAWQVGQTPAGDWRVFVHFTDPSGERIAFQGDYVPPRPTSTWKPGRVEHGPFTVRVPREASPGTYDVRIGLWRIDGPRAALDAPDDGTRRVIVGRVKVTADGVEVLPVPAPAAGPAGSADPGLFVRADNGWAAGMHPYDRFVKNTHEVLSPLAKLTADRPMTGHRFLDAGRTVQESTFGEGERAVTVTVNGSADDLTIRSASGQRTVLPPGGFLIDSQTYVAFVAKHRDGIDYASPTLFTIRATDGKPIGSSRSVRIFHGFGDARLKLGGGRVLTVEREATVDMTAAAATGAGAP